MPLLLPSNPNLRHLRMQVDELLRRFASGEPDAVATVREYVLPEGPLKRAQAQFVLARQYGFESWPRLKCFVSDGAGRQKLEGLCSCIRSGDLEAVRQAIDGEKSLIEGVLGWGMTPLYCAARWGTPRAVALLLEYGANPNVRLGAPMFDCRNIESLRLMLEHGGDATLLHDDHQAHRMSLIHAAAFRDDPEMLNLVMAHGGGKHLNARLSPGNEGRYGGQTALQVAARSRHLRVADALIALGATYDPFSAICLGDEVRVRAWLSDSPDVHNAVHNEVDAYGNTALHWAVEAAQVRVAELLLDSGSRVNEENSFGETPLLLASTHDAHSPDCRVLIPLLRARGAHVDALTAAATGDVNELREIWLRDPLLIHAASVHGWTTLHWAARNGHLEVVRLLIEWGSDVNAADAIGWTPIFPAAYWGQHLEVVKLLAECGADLLHRDKFRHPVTDYDTGEAIGTALNKIRNAR